MTRINRMMMNGFKSFGKRTELLFGDDFNVVLGPNGSGKSNVLDALCFVLGKAGSKSLRAERTANLIYNGGKTKKPADHGEVSIYFDNSEKTFPTEDETIKITRIIKHSGQSVYKINDKTRTRQQILDLLSVAKINPDGYNIILQGDIVKLVEMSPNERREIVEEIAGISIYEERKQKAVRDLDKVQERLNESEIILTERAGYLKDLKKDRDQALKYKELNDKIQTNKASYLKIKINKREAEKQKFDDKNKELTKKLDDRKAKIKSMRDDIAAKKEELKEVEKEMQEKGQKEQVVLQKEIEKLRVEIGTSQNKVDQLQKEIEKIAARKEQLTKNTGELDDKLKLLKEEKKSLEIQRQKSSKEVNVYTMKISDFKKKHKIEDDKSSIEKELGDLDAQIEEEEKKVAALRERQQELLREKDKIEFQIQTFDEKIEKVKEIEKENQAELKRLKGMKGEFKKLTIELNNILNNDSQIARKNAELRQQVYADRDDLSKMSAKNISIKESIGGNVAVQKILENKTKFDGVIGSVSDLGEVGSKYSLAMEVAAGPRMKGIVVRDDVSAAKLIKFLRTNKLGTASFLPLNKVKGVPSDSRVSKLKGSNGVHGLANELIKHDPKYNNIFSYVFGNTLVVDNIDVARRLGIGGIRMVTLDGDLVEPSGAMIGGFRHRKTGAGFKDRDLTDKIAKLETRLAASENELVKLEKSKRDNEDKIERIRKLKIELEGEIITLEKSLHLDSSDLETTKHHKAELQESLKKVDEQLRTLMQDITKNNRSLAELKISKQKVRSKIATLSNPRLLAELNTFEERKTELIEQVRQLDAEMHKLNLQINDVFGRDKDNIEQVVKELDKDTGNLKSEQKELKEKIKDRNSHLKEKDTELQKYHKKSKDLFDKRNKLISSIAGAEQSLYKEDQQSRDVEYKINAISLENTKVKAELASLESEFEQYRGVELDLKKSEEQLKKEISQFEKMRETIGAVNLRALDIYDAVEKEYNSLVEKKTVLEKERQDVLDLMEEIEGKKKELFMKTFVQINEHFKTIFLELSTKGEANLVLESPETVFDGGMLINVKLSGNKFLDIRSLSGGEKTMTALAFLFSIQEFEPASFYVLDEVDAALDKKNSSKLAKLVRKYCNNAQYIVISHNDQVISEADILYGVSMDEHGISKVVSLKV